MVLFEGGHVPADGFLDIDEGLLFGLALGDASGKAGTFGHPEAVFTGINNHLTHGMFPQSDLLYSFYSESRFMTNKKPDRDGRRVPQVWLGPIVPDPQRGRPKAALWEAGGLGGLWELGGCSLRGG